MGFTINEVWILFKLNDVPIIIKQDGEFNVLVLMYTAANHKFFNITESVLLNYTKVLIENCSR